MSHEIARRNLENLSRSVTSRCNKSSINAEPYTTHNALMRKIVDKVNIQNSSSAGIEDGKPVRPLLLEVVWQLIDVQVSKSVVGNQG